MNEVAPLLSEVFPPTSSWTPKETDCVIGVASGDITPPVGIRAHNWGASRIGNATGIHRPLRAGVLAFHEVTDGWRYLITLDLGWWQSIDSLSSVFDPIAL